MSGNLEGIPRKGDLGEDDNDDDEEVVNHFQMNMGIILAWK